MVTQPGRRTAAILVAASLAFIGAMTLQPARATRTLDTLCVFCGPQGGLDFVLNAVLFVPLGIGLCWLLGGWKAPAVIGGFTTLAIELLQFRFVSGRDASLGDLMANSLGTVLGAWLALEGIRWLNASARTAHRLTIASGLLVSAVVSISAWFLLPARTHGPQYIQWAPQRTYTDPFLGRVRSVDLHGLPIHSDEIIPADRLINARSVSVRVSLLSPVPPSRRRAIITHIADRDEEGFSLMQRGNDVLFRTFTTGARFKFRSLEVNADRALSTAASDTSNTSPDITITAVSDPHAMVVRTTQAGSETFVTLRRTVGLGWAVLFPWDVALTPEFWPINAAWLAMLVLPVAFFTARTARAPTHDSMRGLTWWPLVLTLVSILAAPRVLGLSWLTPGELGGVIAGALAGVMLENAMASQVPAELRQPMQEASD